MKTYSLKEAKSRNLIQLTLWLSSREAKNVKILEGFYNGVLDDVLYKREAIYVEQGGLVAVFVNKIA